MASDDTVSEGKLFAKFEKHDQFVELQNKFLDNDLIEQSISEKESGNDELLKLSMIVSVRQFMGSWSLTVTS
jgi:hypothetical protein